MKGYRLFWLALFICSHAVYAQEWGSLPNWKVKNFAKTAEQQGDIYTAIDAWKEIERRKGLKYNQKTRLADLYISGRDYVNAYEIFEKLYRKNMKDPYIFYNYALMAKRMGYYETAEEYFHRFYRFFGKNSSEAKQYQELIDFHINGCELALQKKYNSKLQIELIPGNVNTPHNESSPVYVSQNVLWYSSVRVDDYIFFEQDEIPLKKQYEAEKGDTAWKVVKTEYPILDPTFDIDNGVLSPDKQSYYFTKCETVRKGKQCLIYIAEKNEKGEWSSGRILPEIINSDRFNQTQPAPSVTADGKEILYFSSDRSDGLGGYDIWFSIKYNGQYKEPVNCGKNINSEKDEITPWFDSQNSILYYSSNGIPGRGGFDIFKATGSGRRFSTPKNLGPVYNSGADDLYFILSGDTLERGYLVSNRLGGKSAKSQTCCDDIYAFQKKEKEPEVIVDVDINYEDIIGKTVTPSTDTIKAKLYLISEGKRVLVDSKNLTQKDKLEFKLKPESEYDVAISSPGFLSTSRSVSTKGIKKDKRVTLDSVKVVEVTKEPIEVKNVYYAFDQSYLTDKAKEVLDETIYKTLIDNPSIIIEIRSHTDWFGTDEYNLNLSQERAQAVQAHLIEKGIEPSRIKAKGYGESMPIAPNAHPNGTDNPEGRRKNRRTEFRIIGVIENAEIRYE